MATARIARRRPLWLLAAGAGLACALSGRAVLAEPTDDVKNGPTAAAAVATPKLTASQRLSLSQQQVSAKFKRFEEVLLRMAELTATADPKRAALLRRAVAQSKEHTIGLQMETLVALLGQDKLATALKDQQAVGQELGQLLELLLSEQRSERLKDERQRLKRQIQQLKELINKQVELKAETARAEQTKEFATPQGRLAEEAARLARDMQPPDKAQADAGNSSDKNSSDKKPSDKNPAGGDKDKGKDQGKDAKSSDKQSTGDKSSKQKPGEQSEKADKQSGDSKKSGDGQKPSKAGEKSAGKPQQSPQDSGESPEKSGKPQSGKPPSGKSQPGQPQDQSQSPEDQQAQADQPPAEEQESPGRKRVAAARKAMEEAQKKLEEAKREGAQKDQEEALRQLEQAKAELEEILRQLRDEEVERVLAQLEARFRHMLALEREVYEGTKRLDHVPAPKRGRGDEIEAGRLSRRQAIIVIEAEKALAVLHEEGSAVALPEAVEEMREDMETAVGRLAAAKVDAQTQGIEEDIIAALEETIAALDKAQRDRQAKKPPPGAAGQPQEPPLVDRLAELKMIRALQMRVNTRTQRYSKLVSGDVGQGETPEMLDALKRLAEREQRIFRATRDIVIGRNQ